jgi:hypothetical protein
MKKLILSVLATFLVAGTLMFANATLKKNEASKSTLSKCECCPCGDECKPGSPNCICPTECECTE